MAKRALLYLRRNYKRSILLLILLLIISFSLAVGLSVWGSIDGVVKEVQQTLGTSFNVKLRKEAVYAGPLETYEWCNGMRAATYVGPEVDQELVDKVMQISGITQYNADSYANVYSNDMKLIASMEAIYLQKMKEDPAFDLSTTVEEQTMWTQNTTLLGNTDTKLYDKFRTGAFELVEGRHITPTDYRKALISDKAAELNHLQIGDTITVSSREGLNVLNADFTALWGQAELEIVGIFHVNGYQPIGEYIYERDITYNWILTDVATSNDFMQMFNDNIYVDHYRKAAYENATFFVDDPAQLESAVEQATKMIQDDDKHFDISADDTLYRSTVEPLNFIKTLVTVLTAIIVIGCMIVLAIVFTMWVKSRKKEIAIYLSMGMSKASIIGQLIVEALLVAAVACALAVLVARPAADAIGNGLLTSSIESAAPEEKQYTAEEIHEAAQVSGGISELFAYESGSYGGPEHIDFTFPVWAMLLLVVLEVLVILAAIGKASVFIFQLQPKQILSTLS